MQPSQQKIRSEPLRLVVVDDRAAVRESLRTMLSLEDDIEVVGEAENGRQAVMLAGSLRPDVVLMDFEMPDENGSRFDGIDACREIKNHHFAPVVIILTVHADQEARQRAAVAGCDLFLEKGINTSELLNHIRTLAE